MPYIVVYHGMTSLFAGLGSHLEKKVFVSVCVPFAIGAFTSLLKGNNATLFWSIVGCILVQLTFLDGVDIAHHAYRVLGLIDELHRQDFSGLLINPQTGQAFPIFVYFSFVPYLFAMLLKLTGIPAYIAIKLTLAVLLLVFCGGLHLLLVKNSKLQGRQDNLNSQFLILSLFMCSTCVYGLWTLTDELGEIAIYAFVPWIVLALINSQSPLKLAILFFVQLIVHPVVFGHALLCEIALAYGISNLELWSIIRKILAPTMAALIVATPFWLPQILWVHRIVGNAVIPFRFYDTFMDITQIFDRHLDWGMGPGLILAVGLMVILSRGRMNQRGCVLMTAFVLILAMQTVYLRWIVMRIPGISIFQFIFRFMIPAAFIALGILLGGLSPRHRGTRLGFSVLLVLAFLNMFTVRIYHLPTNVVPYVYDTRGYESYLVDDNALGVAMLKPSYARLPIDCTRAPATNMQKASFVELLNGLTPGASYVSVANAPIGIVRYEIGGTPLKQAACGSDLILGPVRAGGRVFARDDMLCILTYLRVLSMLSALLLFIGIPAVFTRMRRKTAVRLAADGSTATQTTEWGFPAN